LGEYSGLLYSRLLGGDQLALLFGLDAPMLRRSVNDLAQSAKCLASEVILEVENYFFKVLLVVGERGNNPIRLANVIDLRAEFVNVFANVVDGFHANPIPIPIRYKFLTPRIIAMMISVVI
jgi:hypothetical protein